MKIYMEELIQRFMRRYSIDRDTAQRMIDDPAVYEKYAGPDLRRMNEMYREIVALGGEDLVDRELLELVNARHRELTRIPEGN